METMIQEKIFASKQKTPEDLISQLKDLNDDILRARLDS